MLAQMSQPLQTQTQPDGQVYLVPGSPHWHAVHGVAEQVVEALNDLGFVRLDPVTGQPLGFALKELAITSDGKRAVIHLDTHSIRNLYQPQAQIAGGKSAGKPVAFLSLIDEKVTEQIRIRVSEIVGGPCNVYVDNHYWVRWVMDLEPRQTQTLPTPLWTEHFPALQKLPQFTVPLGVRRNGELVTLNLVADQKHVILTGSTGQGKTTFMDAALLTLLKTTDPAQDGYRVALFDPQRGNFGPYAQRPDLQLVDRLGPLGLAYTGAELVTHMVRLNEEHERRMHQVIGASPWANIEDYNAHVAPAQRLPYVFVFMDELILIRRAILGIRHDDETPKSAARAAWEQFYGAFLSLLVGGRKAGFRIFSAVQYLKAEVGVPPEVASQMGLTLAFWTSPQGSKNVLGDTAAMFLEGPGRFIVQGLQNTGTSSGRLTLRGLYVDRETVNAQLGLTAARQTFPVDPLVLEILTYALTQLAGKLTRDALAAPFESLLSRRQLDNLLNALERIGLALPAERNGFDRIPRRLAISTLDEVGEVLQYHPEIAFREVEGNLVFGPNTEP